MAQKGRNDIVGNCELRDQKNFALPPEVAHFLAKGRSREKGAPLFTCDLMRALCLRSFWKQDMLTLFIFFGLLLGRVIDKVVCLVQRKFETFLSLSL